MEEIFLRFTILDSHNILQAGNYVIHNPNDKDLFEHVN